MKLTSFHISFVGRISPSLYPPESEVLHWEFSLSFAATAPSQS